MDKRIRNIIATLNSLGITTTGSCEGHIDHGSPAPWIKVTPLHGKANNKRASKKYKPRRMGTEQLKAKVLEYLNEFYRDRKPLPENRLVIEKARSGFWIHNGGQDYKRWRTFVNETAATIRRGETPRAFFDEREQAHRTEKIKSYQGEMKKFAKFLKQRP